MVSFTYGISVYGGKSSNLIVEGYYSKPTAVVMSLASRYMRRGYTITVDTYYTSMELAEYCLKINTHLQGTLRKNEIKDVQSSKN